MILVMICDDIENVIVEDLKVFDIEIAKYLKINSYCLVTVECPNYMIYTLKNFRWCKSICE